jgi:hypothetical protein
MTLFVMSAYVAFNGFPGQDVQDPIGNLLVQERQTPVSVPAEPARVSVRAATRTPSRAHHGAKAERALGPKASTGPVTHRLPSDAPAGQPDPAGAGSGSGQAPSPTQQPTAQLPGSPPQVTVPPVPQLPAVSLPPVIQAPSQTPLPLDTSGAGGTLSGLLAGN